MKVVAKGSVRKVYVELVESSHEIGRVVLCLDGEKWIELRGVLVECSQGFKLPEPLGCPCIVTDISDRQWGNAKYEVEFASSYSRDGVFWPMEYAEVSGI